MPRNDFNHPGSDGSMDLGFGPDPQRASPDNRDQGSGTGSVTLSSEQFEALMSRVSGAQERDYADALGEVVQLEPQAQSGRAPFDLSSLPDAARDPEGFRTGLGTLLSNARDELAQFATQQAAGHVQQTSIMDQAWEMMQRDYADAAAHPELVQMAATREMEALRARGLDPMAVIAQNPEGYVESVAARAMSTINRVRGFSEQSAEDGGNDRTDMIQGGSPRPGPAKQPAPRGSNLVDELKTIQRELGIY